MSDRHSSDLVFNFRLPLLRGPLWAAPDVRLDTLTEIPGVSAVLGRKLPGVLRSLDVH